MNKVYGFVYMVLYIIFVYGLFSNFVCQTKKSSEKQNKFQKYFIDLFPLVSL